MDRPYGLFDGENDSGTALDDLLLSSEKPVENIWTFKNDHLIPGSTQLDVPKLEERTPAVGSLGEISILHEIEGFKQEAAPLPPCSSDSLALENMHCGPGDISVDSQPRTILPSGNKFIDVSEYGAEEESALSTVSPVNGSNENQPVDYSSESEKTFGNPGFYLKDKIRGLQNNYVVHSNDLRFTPTRDSSPVKEVQKPPTTAGIELEDLKAVFHLERPQAEKKLRLKRTTFSNLSRHYGISKWPFRTIRDAMNRWNANETLLSNRSVSKERRRKITEQQRLLKGVVSLIYAEPRESRDSNTLAVLLRIVEARESPSKYSEL